MRILKNEETEKLDLNCSKAERGLLLVAKKTVTFGFEIYAC